MDKAVKNKFFGGRTMQNLPSHAQIKVDIVKIATTTYMNKCTECTARLLCTAHMACEHISIRQRHCLTANTNGVKLSTGTIFAYNSSRTYRV